MLSPSNFKRTKVGCFLFWVAFLKYRVFDIFEWFFLKISKKLTSNGQSNFMEFKHMSQKLWGFLFEDLKWDIKQSPKPLIKAKNQH